MSRHGLGSAIAAACIIGSAPIIGSCASVQQIQSGLGSPQQLQRDFQRAASDANRVVGAVPVALVNAVAGVARKLNEADEHLTPQQEYFLGRSVCAHLLQGYGNRVVGVEGTGREARGSDEIHYVQSVAQVIAEAAARTPVEDMPERMPTGFRVAVVPDAVPAAYSTPGGFAVITTGMLDLVENEDELAAVLAHEMAHIVLGHGLQALEQGELKQVAEQLATDLGAAGVLPDQVVEGLSKRLSEWSERIVARLQQPYDREWEMQADERAALMLREAGYDARALARVIDRVADWQREHGADEGAAKTHPPSSERLAALSKVEPPQLTGAGWDAALARREVRFQAHIPVLVGAEVARR